MRPLARTGAGLSPCLCTNAPGLPFAALRRRSGNLVASALLYLAIDSLGLLAAAAAHRTGRAARSWPVPRTAGHSSSGIFC